MDCPFAGSENSLTEKYSNFQFTWIYRQSFRWVESMAPYSFWPVYLFSTSPIFSTFSRFLMMIDDVQHISILFHSAANSHDTKTWKLNVCVYARRMRTPKIHPSIRHNYLSHLTPEVLSFQCKTDEYITFTQKHMNDAMNWISYQCRYHSRFIAMGTGLIFIF